MEASSVIAWPDEEEIRRRRDALIRAVEDQTVPLDGVMSPQTRSLMNRLGAKGVDMSFLWVATSPGWICPGCGRSKPDIVRLNKNGDLMCRLVGHHDHMQNLLVRKFSEISASRTVVVADERAERFAKRAAAMVSAYDTTVVCNDCNNIDTRAKQEVGTHADFSYSPQEIRRLAIVQPGLPHGVNLAVAKQIWDDNKPTFALRLKILGRIAEIAATNEHWFQEGSPYDQPDVVIAKAQRFAAYYGVSADLDVLCGERRKSQVQDPSAWRKIKSGAPKTPTLGDIDHVAHVTNKPAWDTVSDDWACPACGRSKRQVVRQAGTERKWSFSIARAWYRSPRNKHFRAQEVLCGDCGWTAQNLGKEAATLLGLKITGYSALVEIAEISSVVIPGAHRRHQYDEASAIRVVDAICQRLRPKEVRVGTDSSRY